MTEKIMTTEQDFLRYLELHQFIFERIEHPAVFTCAAADLHYASIAAVSTKNLFLCDKKSRRFFLVVTACEKTVRLDDLASKLGISHIRFASEENLQLLLGVTRGSVTMMGLVNDTERNVELWVDAEIWKGERFLCHPLVNTATLILSKAELERFLALNRHELHFFRG